MKKKIYIILPIYNEEKIIEKVENNEKINNKILEKLENLEIKVGFLTSKLTSSEKKIVSGPNILTPAFKNLFLNLI